ncbi:putative membrane protein YkvI [Bacillus tianshenii]|uniref:Membrane protein YkvI n=1 Tax=Sutcliffiella tianshenii TaxID=1463404 RepID=A0ABS2NW67_9BACI|nr:GerAB/ArcD/ProY family transporter [Bacillus tianshenii]MBM7618864.1 putative membrane protein YkvI [Bacillus tianshenii]
MWNSGFRWMFLILGTVIGAGYASGREIWQFFGAESGLAILLFTIFFMVACHVVLSLSRKLQSAHFSPVLEKLVGPKISRIYNVVMVIYLFTTTAVMLAGGGAALQVFSIPYWAGIMIICILLVMLFVYGVNGMITVNSIIIPAIILVLALVLFHSAEISPDTIRYLAGHHHSNWPSAFTFTALNILPLVAVLSAIGKEVKTKGEILIASIGSGGILGVISLFYNQTLLTVQSKMEFFEIPLFAVIQSYPYYMIFVMTLLLWVAIYTTAASGLLGLVTRFKDGLPFPVWIICMLLLLCMVPFTAFGFSVLVAILYPLFGLVNLYLLVCILLYPITNRKNWLGELK